MKRVIAILLAALLLIGALPFAGAFSDDASIDDNYKKAVTKMSDEKIIGGFTDGSFKPTETLTRAQAAKILCVMLEGEEKANALTKTETGFADVPASHWAAKYVAYCVENSIVAGVGEGKFDPDGKLSSGAFAKMLLVAYGRDGSKFTGAEWLKNVQAAAETTFFNYHLKDGPTGNAIPRQEAAQLAFNALIQAEADADKAKGDPREYKPSVPETMKLFIIGHSYGNDCTLQYLWQMLKDVGVKDLTIGTLYYSGCPYRKHVDFELQDSPVYAYYKNTTGKYKTTKKTTFDKSLADEKWTHIVMLHGFTGQGSDFAPCPWQDILLGIVRRTQPDAYYGYVMTWAFRDDIKLRDSHAARFKQLYDSDAGKMYQGQVNVAQKYAVPEQRFKYICTPGTAIMNARTSFLGCNVHRDNMSHLNYGIGRYIAAMTMCCNLTGVTPDQITYVPDGLVSDAKNYKIGDLDMGAPGLKEKLVEVAKESVKNALEKPFEITRSQYTTAP